MIEMLELLESLTRDTHEKSGFPRGWGVNRHYDFLQQKFLRQTYGGAYCADGATVDHSLCRKVTWNL